MIHSELRHPNSICVHNRNSNFHVFSNYLTWSSFATGYAKSSITNVLLFTKCKLLTSYSLCFVVMVLQAQGESRRIFQSACVDTWWQKAFGWFLPRQQITIYQPPQGQGTNLSEETCRWGCLSRSISSNNIMSK